MALCKSLFTINAAIHSAPTKNESIIINRSVNQKQPMVVDEKANNTIPSDKTISGLKQPPRAASNLSKQPDRQQLKSKVLSNQNVSLNTHPISSIKTNRNQQLQSPVTQGVKDKTTKTASILDSSAKANLSTSHKPNMNMHYPISGGNTSQEPLPEVEDDDDDVFLAEDNSDVSIQKDPHEKTQAATTYQQQKEDQNADGKQERKRIRINSRLPSVSDDEEDGSDAQHHLPQTYVEDYDPHLRRWSHVEEMKSNDQGSTVLVSG